MLASTLQKPAPESTPITRTATIEAIDKANRTVTLKGPAGNSVEIKAPEQMEGFNSLKVGHQVTATYFAAIAGHCERTRVGANLRGHLHHRGSGYVAQQGGQHPVALLNRERPSPGRACAHQASAWRLVTSLAPLKCVFL